MKRYTISLANVFYLIFIVTSIIWILMVAKVIIAPLVFGFFCLDAKTPGRLF